MIHKKTAFRLTIFGILILFITISTLMVFNKWFLSKNQPIDAKVLVIEGWLPVAILEQIPQKVDLSGYTDIYVTGIAHNHPQYLLNNSRSKLKEMPARFFTNGCLTLTKSALAKINPTDKIFKIKVFAYGSKALGKFPNIFVAVGDSIIGNTFVEEQPKSYIFQTNISITNSNDIFIYFSNDMRSAREDRNLIVDSMAINEVTFNKTSDFCKIYDDWLNIDAYSNYPFSSKGAIAAAYLKVIGVKNNIITIDTFSNKRNRTLITAERFNTFLNEIGNKTEAFNVVSIQKHSRRSYLAYKIATSHKKKIGIISLNNINLYRTTKFKKWQGIIDEYAKVFVTYLEYLF
jgi:hypothetical protein